MKEILPRKVFRDPVKHVQDAIAYRLLPIQPGDIVQTWGAAENDGGLIWVIRCNHPTATMIKEQIQSVQVIWGRVTVTVDGEVADMGFMNSYMVLSEFGVTWKIYRNEEKETTNEKANNVPRITHDVRRVCRDSSRTGNEKLRSGSSC